MSKDNFNPVITGVNETTGESEVGFEFVNATNISKSIEELTGKKIPFLANICIIQVAKSTAIDKNCIISFRQDGATANATQGMTVGEYQFIHLECKEDIKAFRCISVEGTDTPLAIQFYRTQGNS